MPEESRGGPAATLPVLRLGVILTVALNILIAPAGAAPPPAGVDHSTYTGQPVGAECYATIEGRECPDVRNAMVQFGPFDASAIDVDIFDVSGAPIGGTYTFFDPLGNVRSYGTFCSKLEARSVPNGAKYVQVHVDMVFSPKHCLGLNTYGTSGEVVVRYYA